jgi:hypothetical protein
MTASEGDTGSMPVYTMCIRKSIARREAEEVEIDKEIPSPPLRGGEENFDLKAC